MIISIVCPVFSEEKNIKNFYNILMQEISDINRYNFEIIFIDDGSTDETNNIIRELITTSKIPVRLITFSRNFGKEKALTAGLNNCSKSDAVITIDADLQHPIEEVKNLIKHWENGYDLVIGVRNENKGASFFRKASSYLYNRFMKLLANYNFIENSTDFRLMDKKVVTSFNLHNEKQRVFRHIIDSLGYKIKVLNFNANKRYSGKTKFNISSLLRLMSLSIISYSLWPLKILLIFGTLMMLISFCFLVFMFVDMIIFNSFYNFSKLSFLIIGNIFLSSLIIAAIGVVAVYVGSIQTEVINKPLYLIKSKTNFEN